MEKSKQELRARQLEALSLKQFKVGVVLMSMHNFTIMATDEQSAVDKVMKKGPSGEPGGRDAGKEGPVPIGFRVQDMAIIQPQPTLQQVIGEILQGNLAQAPDEKQPKPLITPGG